MILLFVILFFWNIFLLWWCFFRGSRVLRDRYRESGSVNSVPMVIHQVIKTKTIHAKLHGLVRLNQQRNPGYTFRYYDNKDIHRLIRENFERRVYAAFCRIDPAYGACVADFARYCILYLYGGVYLDIKSEIKKDIGALLETMPTGYEMMVYHEPIRERPRLMSREYILSHKMIFADNFEFINWVMVTKPKNEILYDLIHAISETILRGVNGTGKSFVLHLTGPRMFTTVLLKHDLKNVAINDRFLDFFEYDSGSCNGSCRKKYYSGKIDYARLKKKVLK